MSEKNLPKESIIRLMTRMANEHKAINLSQGFTDRPIIFEMLWGLFKAAVGGTENRARAIETLTMSNIAEELGYNIEDFMKISLKDIISQLQGKEDVYNQYSYPFGLVEMRDAVADYTERFQGYKPNPEKEITIVSGATEGIFIVMQTICDPGDEVIVIQPFHEMYPSQALFSGIVPKYITLRQNGEKTAWDFDFEEFENSITDKTKAFIFNTPHNPTGKVFTCKEIEEICRICKKHDINIISDEIYEHILFTDTKHYSIAAFEGMRERTFVVNSISKTGNSTGWRIGWVISPEEYTSKLRGIHDTMVMQAPTPLQKGAVELLKMPDEFYSKLPSKYKSCCTKLITALKDKGFDVIFPEGSYYLFADYSNVPILKELSPMEASEYLIKQIGVASVPGDNFYKIGSYGDKSIRFAFCRSTKSIEEAANRLIRL
ncbi:MAG TPA: pyridoxal phosphate-dependent aminotransferase [Victivallales bacterium]|nr:pyridoxal phosphate-dependent aminotransferase [Victivallales bacterium]